MSDRCVIGIDVANKKRGFHVVALSSGKFEAHESVSPTVIADWCLKRKPQVIAIDSPCGYAIAPEKSRLAERELMKQGIWCYSTPTKRIADERPSCDWVRNGMGLYRVLEDSAKARVHAVSIVETFPHAVACSLAGEVVRASTIIRLRLLEKNGFDTTPLANKDIVDAALCALTAREFATKKAMQYGREEDGIIYAPSWGKNFAT